jgi:hypothetical protein
MKSASTMRSSDKQYNSSCDVSSVCDYESICNDESDNEHLLHLHSPDDLHDKKDTETSVDQTPIPISPIIIPQIQQGTNSRWQRKHNKFVIEALMMQQ